MLHVEARSGKFSLTWPALKTNSRRIISSVPASIIKTGVALFNLNDIASGITAFQPGIPAVDFFADYSSFLLSG